MPDFELSSPGGIRRVHDEPLKILKGFLPVSDLLAPDESTSVVFDITGNFELSLADTTKSYLFTPLGVRVLNACMLITDESGDRESWYTYREVSEAGLVLPDDYRYALNSNALLRKIDALQTLRVEDIDGDGRGIIEKSAWGSSSNAEYRIAPDVAFRDRRPPRA